jgi:hypothetical protein
MSGPPPPPQVSPDGKFYWDGRRWVAMQQEPQQSPMQQAPLAAQRPSQNVGCVTRTTCLTVVGLFVAVAAVLLIAGVCSSIASHH